MTNKNTGYIRKVEDLPAKTELVKELTEGVILVRTGLGNHIILCEPSSQARSDALVLRNKLISEGKFEKLQLKKCDTSILEQIISPEMNSDVVIDTAESKYQAAFNELLLRVIKETDATDIHFECDIASKTLIRIRVGGQLIVFHKWSGFFGDKVVSVLFRVEAKETLNDREVLDANLKRTFDGQAVMLRLNYRPTYGGHDTTIRIQKLGKANVIPFEKAGYTNHQIMQIRAAIAIPQRLVLVVGTTGSGKSTTLQAMITEQIKLNPNTKVITIEDPVEYLIEGARQTQIEPGMDFNSFLVAALRSDPDTMMLGEVRDAKTASMVEKGTLTGHKMYGTLHVSSAFAVIPRLERIGIDRIILSSKDFFNAIICQNLVPHTCPHCSVPMFGVDNDKLNSIGMLHHGSSEAWLAMQRRWIKTLAGFDFKGNKGLLKENIRLSNPTGCDKCINGLTTKRSVVAEVLTPDMKILDYIRNGEDFKAWQHWRENGGVTKIEHGLYKVLQGDLCPVICERLIGPITSDEVHADGVLECCEVEVMGGYVKEN